MKRDDAETVARQYATRLTPRIAEECHCTRPVAERRALEEAIARYGVNLSTAAKRRIRIALRHAR